MKLKILMALFLVVNSIFGIKKTLENFALKWGSEMLYDFRLG